MNLKTKSNQREKESKETHIRLERKKFRDRDQIEERAHQVDRQIQKTLKPTKHNKPVVGWNSDEGLTRKHREKEIGLVELS